jgi:hypothetical protein
MTIVLGLLVFFLAIGVFARSYTLKMRVLMSVVIIALILYMYIA